MVEKFSTYSFVESHIGLIGTFLLLPPLTQLRAYTPGVSSAYDEKGKSADTPSPSYLDRLFSRFFVRYT